MDPKFCEIKTTIKVKTIAHTELNEPTSATTEQEDPLGVGDRKMMCAQCFTPTGVFQVNFILDKEGVRKISVGDWVVILLSMIVVAMAVAAERCDIKLCQLTLEQREDRIALRQQQVHNSLHQPHVVSSLTAREQNNNGDNSTSVPKNNNNNHNLIWHRLFAGINLLRQYGIVAGVVSMTPHLIIHHGSDALSVCMNTISLLFILKIDNVVYAAGLREKLRSSLEMRLHQVLSAEDAAKLETVKLIYLLVVPIFIAAQLILIGYQTFCSLCSGDVVGIFLMVLFPVATGCAEVYCFLPAYLARLAGCAKVLVKTLLCIALNGIITRVLYGDVVL